MTRLPAALLLAAALALGAAVANAAQDCAPAGDAPPGPALEAPKSPGLRIGIALGSGSMHGIAHLGVLRETEASGLDVSVVSGTSAGALVGALWASGMGAGQIERYLRGSGWEDPRRFSPSSEGLFTNQGLRAPLETLFAGRPIESWPRRFGAVATNLNNGQRRIILSGDGAAAVLASTAMPVLLSPVMHDGERLADGALVEPVPVLAARALGADVVIAVDVAYRPYEEPAHGFTGVAFQSMHILVNALAEAQLRDADVVIRMDLHEDWMKCGHDALIAAGGRAFRAAWPEIERRIAHEMRRREMP